MDKKAIITGIAIIGGTYVMAMTRSKITASIIALIFLIMLIKGFADIIKDLKAVMQEDKIDTKAEIQKRILK